MATMPQLKFYNTLTREKEVFNPLDPDNVRMYVCGPTVYDYAHMGNARPVIIFDVLFRLLRHVYGKDRVVYVRNITDVDDKINARALIDFPELSLNEAIRCLTEKTTNRFHADIEALNCLKPTHEPRATQHIDGMIKMIGLLMEKGNAYQAGGEVLFDISSAPDYGLLSNREVEKQLAGARIRTSDHKKNPGDFVLWKLSADNEPGWSSPWGEGRPGWHIECSVMSTFYLGEIFDIHGGGLDLIFPHHENEMAQSCCTHGTRRMANYWMHNGFLQVEGRKMSKSEGNFITIRQVLEGEYADMIPGNLMVANKEQAWNGLVARLSMLKTNYREPINWTASRFTESHGELKSWYRALHESGFDDTSPLSQVDEITEALANDLNVSDAISTLRGFMKSGNSEKSGQAMKFLGLINRSFIRDYPALFNRKISINKEEINRCIDQRLALIANKDWPAADAIRNDLLDQGVHLRDVKDPETGDRITVWEVRQ